MMALPIAAVSGFTHAAPDTKDSLRERLKAVCPAAPRRLNRLTELGLIGAHQCVGDRRLPIDTAIFMACTSGCIADSVGLVRSVVRGQPPMPMDFINVSSNMAGFHIASSLGLLSSNQVVASRDFGWESAIELAILGGGRSFLVGAVEECAWPLDEHRDRLGLAPEVPLLETSQWLWVDRDAESPVATLEWIRRLENDAALSELLRSRSWPADAAVCVSGTAAAHLGEQTGLRPAQGLFQAGHSGMPGASACVRFIERGGGSLLSLNRGRAGNWCAAYISSTPSAPS